MLLGASASKEPRGGGGGAPPPIDLPSYPASGFSGNRRSCDALRAGTERSSHARPSRVRSTRRRCLRPPCFASACELLSPSDSVLHGLWKARRWEPTSLRRRSGSATAAGPSKEHRCLLPSNCAATRYPPPSLVYRTLNLQLVRFG
jgi:hypothetical protein